MSSPVGMPQTYSDDEFADAVAQAYGPVNRAHLIVPDGEIPEYYQSWAVYDVSTGDRVHVAEFQDFDLAVWFVQAHSNQPRINDLIRKSIDKAEDADVRYDELVQTIVHGRVLDNG